MSITYLLPCQPYKAFVGAACLLRHTQRFLQNLGLRLSGEKYKDAPNTVDTQSLQQAEPAFPKTAQISLTTKF